MLVFFIGYVAGIAIAGFFALNWLLCTVIGTICLLLLCLSRQFSIYAVLAAGIAFGALRLLAFLPPGWNIDRYAGPSPVTVVGSIVSDPSLDNNKAFFLLSTDGIQTRKGTFAVHGTTAVLVHDAAISTFQDVRYGDRVQLSGMMQTIFPATNPGEFDWRAHLIKRGISGELVVQRPSGASIIRTPGLLTSCQDWSTRAEASFKLLFVKALPVDESGLLVGILFGDRHGISADLSRDFAATGTSHVLATAGLHVGIFALALALLMSALPISRKSAAVVIIVLVWIFAALAGFRPPVVRAASAATIFLLGRLFERVPDYPTTIAAAALAILAVEPTALFESSFQLSFVTVVGICLTLPYWLAFFEPRIANIRWTPARKCAEYFSELAGLSITAQLSATLLVVYYFNQFSILSLPVNLVVVPALIVIIPVSAVVLVLALVSPAAAFLVAKVILHPLLSLILQTIRWFASLPFCSISLPSPSPIVIILIYAAAIGLLLWRKSPSRQSFESTPALGTDS